MDDGRNWTIIVPVKGSDAAKSRLDLPTAHRIRLARAFAADTLHAVVQCAAVARVVILTPDAHTVSWLGMRMDSAPDGRAQVEADVQPTDESLNAGIDRCTAARRRPDPTACVAVVVADLPSLRPTDLGSALADALQIGRPGVVADTSGLGTTLLALPYGVELTAAFGADSLRRHADAGAVPLDANASLRCDVDTVTDLAAATELGLGPETQVVLRSLAPRLLDMQATVATFDEATHTGTVLLDDGVELPFDADAFASSGLRLLRLGQRVRIDADARRVLALTILTLA